MLTIFPGMFEGPLSESILGRARERELIDIHLHDLRQWTHDRHRTVDDYPFGGGPGMVMKPEPLFEAIETVQAQAEPPAFRVFLTPQGRRLDRALVDELAGHERLLLLCGRYEGVDERVLRHAIDLEVSIGDFVVSGGELPAMLLIDAVSRRVPGVLGDEGSLDEESFDAGLLEYPQYTRPAEVRELGVPDVLLSGNHAEIAKWRRQERLRRTQERRPDLLATAHLTPEERAALTGDPGFARVRAGDTLFEARVSAVAASAGRVLLQRVEGTDAWELPGTPLRVGETVAEAALRLFQDEARLKQAAASEVLWVREDFEGAPGALASAEPRRHVISITMEVALPPRAEARDAFRGERAGQALEYRWVAARDLDGLDLRPAGLVPALREHLAG